jgi:hypothetical protein
MSAAQAAEGWGTNDLRKPYKKARSARLFRFNQARFACKDETFPWVGDI